MLVTGRNIVSSQNEPTSTSTSSAQDEDEELAALLSGLSVKVRHCERCQVPLGSSQDGEESPALCAGCAAQRDREVQSGSTWDMPGVMSTKLRMIVELLNDFHKESCGDKTIIFSQFTSFLDLIEPVLHSHGHDFVRYDGSMRQNARQEALRRIRSDEGTKVILISFKAGSTGLNLTCCNRVILCDLWWNPQIEEQAFDRAHRYVCATNSRLGQSKHVYIYKLSITGTVEQRILVLQVGPDTYHLHQGKKRELARAALDGKMYVTQSLITATQKVCGTHLTKTRTLSISRIYASYFKAMHSSTHTRPRRRIGTCTAQNFVPRFHSDVDLPPHCG